MASMICVSFQVQGLVPRPHQRPNLNQLSDYLSSSLQPLLRELKRIPLSIDVTHVIKSTSQRLLDAFVDSTFKFEAQPWLPSQSNFAPVDEIGDAVRITDIQGEIPADFPEGAYIRNGSNPVLGALQSVVSPFGRSNNIWVEGEGMLHALYFTRNNNNNNGSQWNIRYKNRYVETQTFEIEKKRNKPYFLPTIEGDSPAILVAYLLNLLRFGKVNKLISNTNVFEHAGRIYSIAENHIPQEIDISSLDTRGNWDIGGAWDRAFTAHPKNVPGSKELVIFGVDATKPYLVFGVISADGRKLIHKVDLKFKRSTLCHDIGVTEKYNVIMDMPLTININRLIKGGPLIKYEKESLARIGVMPRYGDADSVKWFVVEPYCAFHTVNCFEDGDEVVVRGCRARGSIIPGPDFGRNKFQWFSEGFKPKALDEECIDDSMEGQFFSRLHEWRLNMVTGNVKQKYLTGNDMSVDFPFVNDYFAGFHNKYGYAQVVDSEASVICALPKYGSLAKFYFEERDHMVSKVEKHDADYIKVDRHQFGVNQFCSGASFVPREGCTEELDGWIITFVHNEDANESQVHIIDTRRFESDPIVKITLPQRVPYGFHGTFISMQS